MAWDASSEGRSSGAAFPSSAALFAPLRRRSRRGKSGRSCALRLETVPAVLLPAAGESGLLLQGSCALIGSPGTVVAVALVCGGSARLRALLSMTGHRALTGDTWSPAANAAAQRKKTSWRHGEPKVPGQECSKWRKQGMRRCISTYIGSRCHGCPAVAMPQPNTNWRHSNGPQSARLGGRAVTRVRSTRRATTIYYDGAGVHESLRSRTLLPCC